jgi:hypothetical protein
MTSVIHVSISISVICFCYFEIYRNYRNLKRNVREIQTSSMAESLRKEKFQLLWITILLVGWTLLGNASISNGVGWSSMLLMILYQALSGHTVSTEWDAFSITMLVITVCGDTVILLVYDHRWRASVIQMVDRLRQRLKNSNE